MVGNSKIGEGCNICSRYKNLREYFVENIVCRSITIKRGQAIRFIFMWLPERNSVSPKLLELKFWGKLGGGKNSTSVKNTLKKAVYSDLVDLLTASVVGCLRSLATNPQVAGSDPGLRK